MLSEVIRIPMTSAEYINEFLEKHQDTIVNLVKGYNFSNVRLISKSGSPFWSKWYFNGFDTDRQMVTMIHVVYDHYRKTLCIETIDNVNGERVANRIDEIYEADL